MDPNARPTNAASSTRAPHPAALTAAFFGCAIIWGSTFLVISIGNETVPPVWAAALRLGIAAVLLTVVGWITRHALPRGSALWAAAKFGFFNLGISLCLLYWAEERVPSGLAAVFYATIPLTSTFLAHYYGLERITWAKVGAATIALAGVAVIFSGQLSQRVPPAPLFALLGAATLAGFGTIQLKRGPRQNPVGANAVGAAVGCAVCLIASFLVREPHPIPTGKVEIATILYLAIAGSIGAFVMMAWLINYWDITRISFVSVIVPVIALALGGIFRHERFGRTSVIGSFLVLIGVMLRIWLDRRGVSAPSRS